MATLVAFSAGDDDYVLVEEGLNEAQDKLGVGNRTPAGLCQLTQLPKQGQTFEPAPILINPDRVAYLKGPPGS